MDPRTTQPTRRTVAKGAAWAAPGLTIAAAAPSLAASPVKPTCACLTPGSIGSFAAGATVVNNVGTIAGTVVFNLNSSACDTGFFRTYTITGTGGQINRATGQPATPYEFGLTTGAGTSARSVPFPRPSTCSPASRCPMTKTTRRTRRACPCRSASPLGVVRAAHRRDADRLQLPDVHPADRPVEHR